MYMIAFPECFVNTILAFVWPFRIKRAILLIVDVPSCNCEHFHMHPATFVTPMDLIFRANQLGEDACTLRLTIQQPVCPALSNRQSGAYCEPCTVMRTAH
jgi:hypothetical protein